jgi:pyruvate/2-oxoglutarate dehydrogenase complex dihydrolipoamide dehydrogenase (E3) component
MDADIAILGGGAAGLSAAREANRRGATAVIVNDGPLGGDCTFTGCVPSKAVIEAAHAGLSFTDAFDRARTVVDHIASTESIERITEEGIAVISAEGRLVMSNGRPSIEAGGQTITPKGVVLSLGSKPFVPPISGLDSIDYLTTENLWELRTAPRSLAVIGGGAIGCELSQAFAGLGVEVTVLELAPRILAKEEVAAADIATAALKRSGVEVLTGVGVSGASPRPDGVTLMLDDGRSIDVEQVLVAVGRTPNSHRGGLQEAGVELDRRGFIASGDDLSTSVKGVYAAGDISGKLQFTHAADHMGRIAAGNILSKVASVRPATFKPSHIPWVTFLRPEIARIGLTESEAAEQIKGAMVAELPLAEHDRALTADATDGFIKLIAGPRPVLGMAGGGRIVGATIVADRAGEMISEVSLAVRLGAFTGRLAQAVHPYPTWSYGLPKAAAQFFTTIEGRQARPAGEESQRSIG